VWQQTLVLWVIADKSFQGTADHGILAHQNDSVTSEGRSDFVHLLGGDIVDADLGEY